MSDEKESTVIPLSPGEIWLPYVSSPILSDEDTTKKCTCGIDAIGGGKHSDYCDLYEGS